MALRFATAWGGDTPLDVTVAIDPVPEFDVLTADAVPVP